MGRLGRIGLEQAVRYERSRPGELVHFDVKKLGRIQGGAGWRVRGGPQHYNSRLTDKAGRRRGTVGWEYVHIAVDYSRLAYAEVLADEKATTAVGFLRRALRFFARYRITVERILTDNGSAYRSTLHAVACRKLSLRHLRSRPYRPQRGPRATAIGSKRPSPRPMSRLRTGWPTSASSRSSTPGAVRSRGSVPRRWSTA
jgi:hypothetical protein